MGTSAALPLALHPTQLLMELPLQLLQLLLQLLLLLQHQPQLELATTVLLLARLMRSPAISRMALSARLTSLLVPNPQWHPAPSRMSLVPPTAPWSAVCLPVTAALVPLAVIRLMACATGLLPSRLARPSSSRSRWLSELLT